MSLALKESSGVEAIPNERSISSNTLYLANKAASWRVVGFLDLT